MSATATTSGKQSRPLSKKQLARLARRERRRDARAALQHSLAHVLPDNIRQELATDDPRRSWIAEAQRRLLEAGKDSSLTTDEMLEGLAARFAGPESRQRERRPRPLPAFFAREAAREVPGANQAA